MPRAASLLRDLWTLILVVWLIGAFTSKHSVRRQGIGPRLVQLALLGSAVVLLSSRRFAVSWLAWRFAKPSAGLVWAGVAITAAGIGFALWARFTIGRNWSGDVTIKADHELVLHGPYRIVRHPIYSGITLALLGTAIAMGEVRGLLAVVLGIVAWRIKWPSEERFMLEEFGDRYADYRRRVSALIPGIW